MENDITTLFCDVYFSLTNKNIHITLTNGEELYGCINGYYYDDLDIPNKKISIWHFIENSHKDSLAEEFSFSKLIPHQMIRQVKYLDNNLEFKIIAFNN